MESGDGRSAVSAQSLQAPAASAATEQPHPQRQRRDRPERSRQHRNPVQLGAADWARSPAHPGLRLRLGTAGAASGLLNAPWRGRMPQLPGPAHRRRSRPHTLLSARAQGQRGAGACAWLLIGPFCLALSPWRSQKAPSSILASWDQTSPASEADPGPVPAESSAAQRWLEVQN